MRRISCAVTGGLMALALLPSPAVAAEASVTTERDGSILWTVASLSDPVDSALTLKILSPRDSAGHRRVVQRCHFPEAAAGEYRCGLHDSAVAGVDAYGNWKAKSFVDGELSATISFADMGSGQEGSG